MFSSLLSTSFENLNGSYLIKYKNPSIYFILYSAVHIVCAYIFFFLSCIINHNENYILNVRWEKESVLFDGDVLSHVHHIRRNLNGARLRFGVASLVLLPTKYTRSSPMFRCSPTTNLQETGLALAFTYFLLQSPFTELDLSYYFGAISNYVKRIMKLDTGRWIVCWMSVCILNNFDEIRLS